MFFINEELTKQHSDLFYQAHRLVKNKYVASVWTFDGVIHIREKSDTVYRIESQVDNTIQAYRNKTQSDQYNGKYTFINSFTKNK